MRATLRPLPLLFFAEAFADDLIHGRFHKTGLFRQAFRRLPEHGQPHGYMEPTEQMLCVWVQVELEIPHGVAAVGEERDLLVQLVALRFGPLKQAAFRLLVIRLHKRKALAGDRLLGFLPPCEGQQTLPNDHFKPPGLMLCADIARIDAYGQRAIGDGQAASLRGTAADGRPLFLPPTPAPAIPRLCRRVDEW
jgi:hypothetical protein